MAGSARLRVLFIAWVRLIVAPGIRNCGDSLYLVNDSGDLYEDLTKNTLPILNGIAPAIHLPTSGVLGEITEHFYMEFKGFIKSDKKANKTFIPPIMWGAGMPFSNDIPAVFAREVPANT